MPFLRARSVLPRERTTICARRRCGCSVALGVTKRALMRYFTKAHTLFYGGAQARFSRKSAPHPLCARRLDGLACRAAREKPWWVPASPDRVRRRRRRPSARHHDRREPSSRRYSVNCGTSHAKNAKGAKNDRIPVASHLVCDVGASRTASEPSSRRYSGGWPRRESLGFSWRSWRASRDARAVSRRERKGLKCQHLSDTGQARGRVLGPKGKPWPQPGPSCEADSRGGTTAPRSLV
jgi:hypothetical protein